MNNIKNINWEIIKWIFIVVAVLLYLQSQRYHFITFDIDNRKVYRYDKFTGKSKAYEGQLYQLTESKSQHDRLRQYENSQKSNVIEKDATSDSIRENFLLEYFGKTNPTDKDSTKSDF